MLDSSGVSIIDTATISVVGFIPLEAGFFQGIALNTEGTRLYVVDQDTGRWTRPSHGHRYQGRHCLRASRQKSGPCRD